MGSPTIFAGRRTKVLTTEGLVLRDGAIIDNDGPINIIDNGHFELTVLPWAAYQNTPGSTPLNGSGGSPVSTFVRSTSSPIYGQASGLFTKGAANRQGEGFSVTVDAPAGYQSKVINLQCDLEMSSGYDGVLETMDIFLYDVTNGALLTAGASTRVAAGKSQFSCSYTNSSNSVSLRAIFHVSGTGTTAWTAKVDDVRTIKLNITGAIAAGFYNGGQVDLPTGPQVLVGRTTTDTAANRLKNKDLEDATTNIVDDGDPTKKVGWSVGGATTSTKTTHTYAQTANRTVTWPDATDTVMMNATQATVTNKDIDGGSASNLSRVTIPKGTTSALTALTRKQGTIVYDTTLAVPSYDDGTNLIPLSPSTVNLTAQNDAKNYAIATSVAANAMTIALKTKAGTDATALDSIVFGMRSSTITSGVYTTRTLTSALSMVLPSGATLGAGNGSDYYIYIYVLDNSGTLELAAAGYQVDANALQSTTALSGSSTSGVTLYSTTSRSSVPVKYIGRIKVNETSAGVYASNATEVGNTTQSPDYETGVINLAGSGTFSTGTLTYTRIGDMVTLCLGVISHSSANGVSSAVGVIPATIRPGGFINNVYILTGSPAAVARWEVGATGQIAISYYDAAFGSISTTGFGNGSLTYSRKMT